MYNDMSIYVLIFPVGGPLLQCNTKLNNMCCPPLCGSMHRIRSYKRRTCMGQKQKDLLSGHRCWLRTSQVRVSFNRIVIWYAGSYAPFGSDGFTVRFATVDSQFFLYCLDVLVKVFVCILVKNSHIFKKPLTWSFVLRIRTTT